jgi:hypothetical protein
VTSMFGVNLVNFNEKNHSFYILYVLLIFISLRARSRGPPIGCAVIFVWLLARFSSS